MQANFTNHAVRQSVAENLWNEKEKFSYKVVAVGDQIGKATKKLLSPSGILFKNIVLEFFLLFVTKNNEDIVLRSFRVTPLLGIIFMYASIFNNTYNCRTK